MGRKAKEGSVNLYYLKNQKDKKEKSVSKNISTTKNKRKTPLSSKKRLENKDEKFNFDDEIVIGVTKIPASKNKASKEKKNKTNKISNKKSGQSNKNKKKPKKNVKILKYVFLLSLLVVAVICIMLSPIFNITEIKVNGNEIVSIEKIISLSEIKIGENIYKTNKNNITNKIKQNPYIEAVSIKRRIPSILEINIKERQATYMLEYVNNYVYINNQGYMLEIAEQKIERPIIIGIITNSENIKPGNRLVQEDLVKIEEVLKIMESATSNEIEKLITKIDISDKKNYTLYLETEGKTVRLGDISDISTKMLHIKTIIEKEAGIEGEIIVDSVAENSKSRFIQKIN